MCLSICGGLVTLYIINWGNWGIGGLGDRGNGRLGELGDWLIKGPFGAIFDCFCPFLTVLNCF